VLILAQTLWTECSIGSTATLLGTFAIAAGINHLRLWTRDVFWPWYKVKALGVDVMEVAASREHMGGGGDGTTE
jgi:hypothetical protein